MRQHYHVKRSGLDGVWYLMNRGRVLAAFRTARGAMLACLFITGVIE